MSEGLRLDSVSIKALSLLLDSSKERVDTFVPFSIPLDDVIGSPVKGLSANRKRFHDNSTACEMLTVLMLTTASNGRRLKSLKSSNNAGPINGEQCLQV